MDNVPLGGVGAGAGLGQRRPGLAPLLSPRRPDKGHCSLVSS